MTNYIPSRIGIIQKVPKTTKNQYGIKFVQYIPHTKTAWVIIGGSGTQHEKNANNYASRINALLNENHISDVNIFSIFYKLNSRNTLFDRVSLFRRAGRRIKMDADNEQELETQLQNEPTPAFLQKLFDTLIRPRIFKKRGGGAADQH